MFEQSGRIKRDSQGIRFYEKDIIYSDYIFIGDAKIELEIDYINYGFGIVLMRYEENSESNSGTYIFKIGNFRFDAIKKTSLSQENMMTISNNITIPNESLKLELSKTGREIELKSEDKTIGYYLLEESIDRYKIGIYSNRDNLVKYMNISSRIPEKWKVSTKNTNGGKVSFRRDEFSITGCEKNAEIEQSNVHLNAGNYIYSYEKMSDSDINSYIFLSDDKRMDDSEKNIIVDGNKITLIEDSNINIKFKGTVGTVKNISIKENESQPYVSSDRSIISTGPSKMLIDIRDLKEIRIEAEINSLPEETYNILSSINSNIKIENINADFNKLYKYIISIENNNVSIEDGKEELISLNIDFSDDEEVEFFYNVNGKIYEIILITKDDKEINLLAQSTEKIFIPDIIKSPILLVDKDNVPLDISSSYRFYEDENGDLIYKFTNWEREIFDTNKTILLNKRIKDSSGNIKVYGILDEEPVEENIFKVENELIDSIDLYTEDYELIEPSEYTIDYNFNEIFLNDDTKDKYNKVAIDYIKNDSYCINHNIELKSYEVDVATSKDEVYLIYDLDEENLEINEYEITEIQPSPERSKYIILRKS